MCQETDWGFIGEHSTGEDHKQRYIKIYWVVKRALTKIRIRG